MQEADHVGKCSYANQLLFGGKCNKPILTTCDERHLGGGKKNGSQQTGSSTGLASTVITAVVLGV